MKKNLPRLVSAFLLFLCAGPAHPGEEDALHPGFDLLPLRPESFKPRVTGMDFLSGGRLAVSTWRPNEVYVLGDLEGPRARISVRKIAGGFGEIMGLCVVNDTVFVADQDRLWALTDRDGDGYPETKTSFAEIPYTRSFHEWSFGLVRKDGRFHTGLSVATAPSGTTLLPQKDSRRGSMLSVAGDGKIDIYASGFRAPDGLCLGPEGGLFATDNQGSWLPASKFIHVVAGRTYGHRIEPPGLFDARAPSPPAVWLPYGDLTRAPTQPACVTAGPYAGQCFYGDIAYGVVQRVFLEKVGGEYQGCVLRFTGGFEAAVHRMLPGPDGSLYVGGLGNGDVQNWGWNGRRYGLQRLKPNGKPVFEIMAARSRKGGLELEFSRPPGPEALEAARYAAKQWWYEPAAGYGGPKKDIAALAVGRVRPSRDGKRILLEIAGLKTGHVLHVRLQNVRSRDGMDLWTRDVWYTLNAISTEEIAIGE